jgi:hypothetical protein
MQNPPDVGKIPPVPRDDSAHHVGVDTAMPMGGSPAFGHNEGEDLGTHFA